MWFGARPWVVVADAELGRRANFRLLNRPFAFTNPLARGEALDAAKEGLFLARDGVWALLRRVWQPAFRGDALARYAPLMAAEARGLVARLARAARRGSGATDVRRHIGAMTMSVVGSTAYGVDFRLLGDDDDSDDDSDGDGSDSGSDDGHDGGGKGHHGCRAPSSCSSLSSGAPSSSGAAAGEDDDDARPRADARAKASGAGAADGCCRKGSAAAGAAAAAPAAAAAAPSACDDDGGDDARKRRGAELVRAAADMFAASEISNATRYLVAAHLMPVLAPAIRLLAAVFPDARYRRLEGARNTLRRCGQALIDDTRAAQAALAAAAAAGGDPHVAGVVSGGGHFKAGAAPGSFLGLLLAARDASGHALSDRQMAAQCNVFTLAGYETTSNALAYAIYCLAQRPDAQARLLAELDALGGDPSRDVTVADLPRLPYTAAVIDEALRLFPPGASTMREARGGLELGGYSIPDGTTVIVAVYSLHRDAAYWPKAGEFLPERWLPGHADLAPATPHAYLPFGAGARMCIGHRFALQEARLTLAALYRRFTFELEPGQVPLRVKTGITMSPEGGVRARVVPRALAAAAVAPAVAAAVAPAAAPAAAPAVAATS